MVAVRKPTFRALLLVLLLPLALNRAHSQQQNQAIQPPTAQPGPQEPASITPVVGTIGGVVKSGNLPIPGAAVSISIVSSSRTISTWTDVDGSYSGAVPAYGSYTVRVQMVAFASRSQEVMVDASHQTVRANFELKLLSRTQEQAPQPRRPGGPPTGQRGFQSLAILQTMSAQDNTGVSNSSVVPDGMPVPGIDPNSATESIAVSGNTTNSFNGMSGDELQQRINDARQQGGGFGGGGGLGGPGGFGGGGPGRRLPPAGEPPADPDPSRAGCLAGRGRGGGRDHG